jgi:hypothetical protein
MRISLTWVGLCDGNVTMYVSRGEILGLLRTGKKSPFASVSFCDE